MTLVTTEFALKHLDKVVSVRSSDDPKRIHNIRITGFTNAMKATGPYKISKSPNKVIVYDILVDNANNKKTEIIRDSLVWSTGKTYDGASLEYDAAATRRFHERLNRARSKARSAIHRSMTKSSHMKKPKALKKHSKRR